MRVLEGMELIKKEKIESGVGEIHTHRTEGKYSETICVKWSGGL